jgi:hypothetical protein
VETTIKELKIELRGSDRLQSYTVETASQEIAALLMAQAVLVNHRIHAAKAGEVAVLRISFAQVQRFLRALWWMLDTAGPLMGESQIDTLIRRTIEKLGKIYVSAPRRKRSCPREIRQPVSSWPRKIRNSSWNGDITHEIIPFSNSKS